jgi:hypothetical protein
LNYRENISEKCHLPNSKHCWQQRNWRRTRKKMFTFQCSHADPERVTKEHERRYFHEKLFLWAAFWGDTRAGGGNAGASSN